jgi:cytochrome b561
VNRIDRHRRRDAAGGDRQPHLLHQRQLQTNGPMPKSPARFDTVSIILHWSVAAAIIAVAAIELLRGDVFPKGGFWREALKTLHNPVGTVVFGLIILRILWRFAHPAPAMPQSMRPWEKAAAKLTHHALYLVMVMIPLTGILSVLARGRPIDFGLFQIVYPLDHVIGRNASRTLKDAHEFLGQAVLALAFVHAAAALWHHYVRKDGVLTRMLPMQSTKNSNRQVEID